MKKFFAGLGVVLILAACGNPAAPKTCIEVAEEAGAPAIVLEFLANPTGELGTLERLAIRQFLNHTPLNDACGAILDEL